MRETDLTYRLTVTCAIIFAVTLLLVTVYGRSRSSNPNYVLVVDCGSSGTRLNIIRREDQSHWQEIGWQDFGVPFPGFKPKKKGYNRLETLPGIHNAADEGLQGVQKSLLPIIEWAKNVFPASDRGKIPIMLFATAGVRKLTADRQKLLMSNIKLVLSSSSFKFQNEWAKIITGEDEGTFSWVSLNYKLDTLLTSMRMGGLQPFSVADLGGSSLQVSCVMDPSMSSRPPLQVLNNSYVVESESFNRYGMNDAFQETYNALAASNTEGEGKVRHPCLQEDYVPTDKMDKGYIGNFDFDRCADLVQRSAKSNAIEHFGNRCGRRGQKYVAITGFSLVYQFFDIDIEATISTMAKITKDKCSSSFKELTKEQREHPDASSFCFRAVYSYVILRKWLHLDDTKTKHSMFSNWALGAAVVYDDKIISTEVPVPGVGQSLVKVMLLLVVSVFAISVYKLRRKRKAFPLMYSV